MSPEWLVLAERFVVAVERLAAAAEVLAASAIGEPDGAEAEPVEAGCPHPADQRISFGVTSGQPDWHCRACGFRSTEGAVHG